MTAYNARHQLHSLIEFLNGYEKLFLFSLMSSTEYSGDAKRDDANAVIEKFFTQSSADMVTQEDGFVAPLGES